MKILVTGGAGFIGSHYARSLLAGRYGAAPDTRITVLDKLTYAGDRENLPAHHDRLEFVRGDVCDGALLRELLPGHDAIVHFAAESHVDRSVAGGREFVRTNALGTQVLLEAASLSRVERVLHISTDEVYGSIEQGSWTEEQPLLPNSPYAASKASADLIARSYWRTHGLDVSITRCSNNYGPYQHPEKLVPRFVTNLLQGRKVPVYGDGRNRREWIHVDDHCRAIHLVLAKGGAGEIYNVGSGDELENLRLAEHLLALCGADASMIEYVEDRKGHDLRYALDDTKIREQLGYEPRVPLDRGIAETVAWYEANPRWWQAAGRREE
ncbi:dTDP-glucose 4,6-dehydratase [Streptomyces griseus]|uniref:dTDP-glucose 4,6-dehydratase n=1 Tax=Streptomyces griseus TaxID=1911 RepID=UPI00382C3656